MIKRYLLLGWTMLSCGLLMAQQPQPTTARERLDGYNKRVAISSPHLLQNLEFKSVGPTIMGGRVIDIDVNPDNSSEFYVAYASGGLWYTVNNGQSYRPLFDGEMVMSIGDIAVNWKTGAIWLGSGENNSSRSSYSGFGIYLSEDTGKTWIHKGLEESHHIGRIVLHPDDDQMVHVAVIGHLYSENEERGVYRTTDGGSSWAKVLFVDLGIGAIDLVMHPKDPKVLYAALWQRHRQAWDFTEGGQWSGVYRSGDGGITWNHFSGEGSAFPTGNIGRIGLAMSADGDQLYALVDNQNRRPEKKGDKKEGLTKDALRDMSAEDFAKVSEKDLKTYLEKNNFPKELTADSIRKMISGGKAMPHHLVDFIEDANRDLFDTEVVGAEVYQCVDGIPKWKRSHEDYLDDLIFTYGYYFGQIRVSPRNSDEIYITGVPLLKSTDAGKTFKSINGDNQHVDHHALWIDPLLDGHLINGNDGGINISYDGGMNWTKVNSPPVGQFYTVSADRAKPYKVYGGLQDNGVWMGPSNYKEGTAWQNVGRYPYERIMGGDGFQVEIDRRDNKTVYTGYQFGHYYRFSTDGGRRTYVTPAHKFGERPLRFNWQTPIHLSKHNQDVFYIASNKFHRSLDQGNSYDLISKDLTKGGKKGDVSYGTISTMDESPLVFGLIYVGSDDGLVHVSHDLGYNWEKIDNGLPSDMWVSRVEASHHDTDRVYLALNGYRWDHFEAMIYMSDDRGKNWTRIGQDLPLEPVNVILEDHKNENLLYVGTDHGLYISLDRGKHFMYMDKNLPAVSVHDLFLQEIENELLVGTHGRSIYKADVSHVQQLNENVLTKGIHFYAIPSVMYRENWGKKWNNWTEINKESLVMPIYVKEKGTYRFRLETGSGMLLKEWMKDLDSGLNYPSYDKTIDEEYLKSYASWLKKKSADMDELEKADDGNYYIKPGAYRIVVENLKTGDRAEQKLMINGKKKDE